MHGIQFDASGDGRSGPKDDRKDFWHYLYALRALLDADVALVKAVALPSWLDLSRVFSIIVLICRVVCCFLNRSMVSSFRWVAID